MRPARAVLRVAGTILAALVVLLPSPATAQPPGRPYRIGVVNEAWAVNHPTVEGLKAGLGARGLVEGRDVEFDIRFTEGNPEATPRAAAELVASGVDLLFTSNEAATRAAMDATDTVPIVFTLVGDPVVAGIVERLARPGRNVTGVSSLTTELVRSGWRCSRRWCRRPAACGRSTTRPIRRPWRPPTGPTRWRRCWIWRS